MDPIGDVTVMISGLPANTPAGSPPPMILPRATMSGVTPKCSWAPPRPSLKPVMTSSKISTIPFSSVMVLRPFRKSMSGAMKPLATGSMIMAASWFLCFLISFSVLGRSLNGRTTVFSRMWRGSPAEFETGIGAWFGPAWLRGGVMLIVTWSYAPW